MDAEHFRTLRSSAPVQVVHILGHSAIEADYRSTAVATISFEINTSDMRSSHSKSAWYAERPEFGAGCQLIPDSIHLGAGIETWIDFVKLFNKFKPFDGDRLSIRVNERVNEFTTTGTIKVVGGQLKGRQYELVLVSAAAKSAFSVITILCKYRVNTAGQVRQLGRITVTQVLPVRSSILRVLASGSSDHRDYSSGSA